MATKSKFEGLHPESDMDSPGFKRLTKDRARYEALVEDTRRRQEEALAQARKEGPPTLKERPAARKDTDYPKPKRRK